MWAVWVVAGVVGAGLVGVVAVPAVAGAAPAVAGAVVLSDGVYEPDVSAATREARSEGRAVAVDSLTTSQQRTSVLPNGSFTYEVSSVPERVRKNGGWAPVDTSLVKDGGWLVPAVSAAPVRFAAGGSAVLDQVQSPGGGWVTESWPYGALPTPTVHGNTATYPEVLPGVDVTLTATETGMSSVYVVKSATAAFGSVLKNLHVGVAGAKVARNQNGEFTASLGDGQPVRSGAPLWWDSSHGGNVTAPGGDDPMRPVVSSLAATGPVMDVGATLGTAAVTYPVFVDPDWSSGDSFWWYTDKAFPNASYSNVSLLRVGIFQNYQSDMFFEFPIGALAGKTVLSAQLATTQLSIDACPTNAIAIETYGPPKGHGFSWNQEQSYGGGQWGGVMQVQTPGSCSSPNTAVPVGWNVTSGVAAKLGQPIVQFGILSNSAAPSRRHFSPSATLTVTYDTPPDTPTNAAFVTPTRSCSTDSAAPVSFNGNQSVTVSVNQTDPDAGNVADNFFVLDFTTGTLALHYGTEKMAQGQISWTFSASSLTPGHLYGWYARGSDYVLDGANPGPTCFFAVDNAVPVSPVVSAVAGSRVVGQPVSVSVSAGSSSDVVGFEYWFGYSSVTSPAASAPVPVSKTAAMPVCGSQQGPATFVCATGSSTTVTVAPVDDRSTLWVASYDGAGNLSAATPLVLTNPGGSAATEPAAAPWHEWLPLSFGSPVPSVLADANTTPGTGISGEKDLTVGSGLPRTVTDSIGAQPAAPVLSFSGTVSSTTLAQTSAAGVDTTQSFTASAWVKPATSTGTMAIIAQSGATNSGFVLEDVGGSMTFCVQPQNGAGSSHCATAAVVSPVNTWVMVTGIWDAVNHQVRLVLGTNLPASVVAPHVPPTGDVTAAGVVTIGSAQVTGTAANPWNGKIASAVLIQEPADTTLLTTLSNLFT